MTSIIQRPQNSHQLSDDIHPLLQRIYAARGIKSDQELDYRLTNLLPPDSLKDLDKAVSRLVIALEQQQRVLIVGDFDADGATSCALSILALKAMGLKQVDFLVPNRFEYGYGLTPEIVDVAKGFSPDLIITVDNGIASVSGVSAANQAGVDVIITDHHLPPEQLPDACAIVNPNQPGCQFPSKNLAGVGVAFYLFSALRRELRVREWFSQQKIAEPNMADFLDLVALGTVADVVPLDANNRILVYQGLQRLRVGRARPGIIALLQVAGKQYSQMTSTDLGFIVGPRLNAAGRLDDMSIGIQCLLSDNSETAYSLAVELDQLNKDRRAIESSMQTEALQQMEKLSFEDNVPFGICLYDENWHQGVVGILASRVKDKYHRPVIAFAPSGADDNEIKGSARSISACHIRDLLDAIATRYPSILQKFGGHAMAAGLTLDKSDFQAFTVAFNEELERQLNSEDLQQQLLSDGELHSQDLNLETAQLLKNAGPWGQGFSEPIFHGEFFIVQQRVLSDKHVKCVLALDESYQHIIDAIAFNTDIEQWKNLTKVSIVYQLNVNEYRGQESAQFIIRHLMP